MIISLELYNPKTVEFKELAIAFVPTFCISDNRPYNDCPVIEDITISEGPFFTEPVKFKGYYINENTEFWMIPDEWWNHMTYNGQVIKDIDDIEEVIAGQVEDLFYTGEMESYFKD